MKNVTVIVTTMNTVLLKTIQEKFVVFTILAEVFAYDGLSVHSVQISPLMHTNIVLRQFQCPLNVFQTVLYLCVAFGVSIHMYTELH